VIVARDIRLESDGISVPPPGTISSSSFAQIRPMTSL